MTMNPILTRTSFLALSVLLLAGVVVAAKQPPREFFGLRIGMDEETARERLRRVARQDKEEREAEGEGEQEVWLFKGNSKYSYVLAKFNREHRLSWITVVARPKRVRYSDIASLDLATKATDGINYSYKWKVPASRLQPAIIIIARGSDTKFLTSYSVYPTVSP